MPSESPSDGICFPKRIILPQAYANPFYRIGNSKKNPFHSHAGKPVFDFGYFWLFRVIYESSFPQKRESVFYSGLTKTGTALPRLAVLFVLSAASSPCPDFC
ncbi:hypothetical protein AB9R16_05270 [Neisseria gonorrhoeae]